MTTKISKLLKQILDLNNWFIAHNMSSYKNADQSIKDHIDKLALEFNQRWKPIAKKITDIKTLYTEAELQEAIKKEREECALICDEYALKSWRLMFSRIATQCAKLIRERKLILEGKK